MFLGEEKKILLPGHIIVSRLSNAHANLFLDYWSIQKRKRDISGLSLGNIFHWPLVVPVTFVSLFHARFDFEHLITRCLSPVHMCT